MNKSSIPNIFTFINLSLGIIAIILGFKGMADIAGACILTAALIDRYDGKIARKINAVSVLGKELDSLSDLVSFGTAPAVVAWNLSFASLGIAGYVPLLVFPICGAFRLARFNVMEFQNVYTGVPITIAGSLAALDIIAAARLGIHPGLSAIFLLLLSYLMVSTIKIKKV
jgi:CDP-diacylglycerol--serine O-phosphatidyltransferase